MKKIVILLLAFVANVAFASFKYCYLGSTKVGKVGIFTDSSDYSLVESVEPRDLKAVAGLVRNIQDFKKNGICRTIAGSECRISNSNSGDLGIYAEGEVFPIALTKSSKDVEKLSALYKLLTDTGLCK